MRESVDFFKTVLKSLSPDSYKELGKRSIRQATSYFLSLVFIMFVLMLVLSFNDIVNMPNTLQSEFNKLNDFSISVNAKTTAPILIPSEEPVVTIDLSEEPVDLTEGNILITNDFVEYKLITSKKEPIDKFKNVSELLELVSDFAFLIILLMFPVLVILFYLIYLIKFAIIIFAASIIAILILRLIAYDIKIMELVRIGIYSSTIMILLEFLSVPFGFSRWMIPVGTLFLKFYIVPIILFILMFIIAIILAGERDLLSKIRIHK